MSQIKHVNMCVDGIWTRVTYKNSPKTSCYTQKHGVSLLRDYIRSDLAVSSRESEGKINLVLNQQNNRNS